MKVLRLDEQLEEARVLESGIAPPVSVWLHGDFNPNNIMYKAEDNSIRFIDIHRSRFGDYLQDVTVFLVGMQRDPSLSPSIRRQLRVIEAMFLQFASEFANEFEDVHWQQRMLLGLSRSYITSSRIILQPAHAEWLFREGRITLQRFINNAAR
jgi:aminoglycoside phosphotransferase (APT) family kinase protein